MLALLAFRSTEEKARRSPALLRREGIGASWGSGLGCSVPPVLLCHLPTMDLGGQGGGDVRASCFSGALALQLRRLRPADQARSSTGDPVRGPKQLGMGKPTPLDRARLSGGASAGPSPKVARVSDTSSTATHPVPDYVASVTSLFRRCHEALHCSGDPCGRCIGPHGASARARTTRRAPRARHSPSASSVSAASPRNASAWANGAPAPHPCPRPSSGRSG